MSRACTGWIIEVGGYWLCSWYRSLHLSVSLCPLLLDGFNLNLNSPLVRSWQPTTKDQGSHYIIRIPWKKEILTFDLFPKGRKSLSSIPALGQVLMPKVLADRQTRFPWMIYINGVSHLMMTVGQLPSSSMNRTGISLWKTKQNRKEWTMDRPLPISSSKTRSGFLYLFTLIWP